MSLTVLMVNNLYAPRQVGGAEKSVQLLAESLAAAGHAVHVLTLIEQAPTQTRTLNGVQIHECVIQNRHWPFGASRKSAAQRLQWHWRDLDNTGYDDTIQTLFDQLRPDVVHTHNLAGFSTRIWTLARQRGIRAVHTLRDYYLSCPSSTRYRRDRNCTATCLSCKPFELARKPGSHDVDAVVGISQFILDDHLARGFFRNTPTRVVIANTVELRPLQRQCRTDGRVRTLGFLGMLTPSKGIEQLLAAFSAEAPPDATLLVGGSGDDSYVQTLKARHTHPGIRFLGFVDPLTVYARADVMVVPSLWNEPFSRVAMEAVAYGVPLVASDRGGLSGIAADAGAILFEPDLKDQLATVLRDLFARDGVLQVTPQRPLGPDAKREQLHQTQYERIYREDHPMTPEAPTQTRRS
jgi:glycosyltransferase involved in cell wall biosynthesis